MAKILRKQYQNLISVIILKIVNIENENFMVFAEKHAGGNGNLIINFAWPYIGSYIMPMGKYLEQALAFCVHLQCLTGKCIEIKTNKQGLHANMTYDCSIPLNLSLNDNYLTPSHIVSTQSYAIVLLIQHAIQLEDHQVLQPFPKWMQDTHPWPVGSRDLHDPSISPCSQHSTVIYFKYIIAGIIWSKLPCQT